MKVRKSREKENKKNIKYKKDRDKKRPSHETINATLIDSVHNLCIRMRAYVNIILILKRELNF